MIVIGTGNQGEYICKVQADELLKILGHSGPVVNDMFKLGQQIKVSAKFNQLQYFAKNATTLKAIVEKMRIAADRIEEAIPEGTS